MIGEEKQISKLNGPPAGLDQVAELAARQFGENRLLQPGHKDYGLSKQFLRMEKVWKSGNQTALWFGAFSKNGALH